MGQTKAQRVIKQLAGNVQKQTAIATDMFIPNHSGRHDAGTTGTPTNDNQLANKEYVDEEIDTAVLWEVNGTAVELKTARDVDLGTKELKWGSKAYIKQYPAIPFVAEAISLYSDVIELDADGDVLKWSGSSLAVPANTSLGSMAIPFETAYINTIDLGTNTITDGDMTGDWDVDGELSVGTNKLYFDNMEATSDSWITTSVSTGDFFYEFNGFPQLSFGFGGLQFYGDVDVRDNDFNNIANADITTATIGGSTNYTEWDLDGVQTMHGDARVNKSQMIDLTSMKRGVGNPPAEGLKDGFVTFDFDDSTEEEVFFKFIVPDDYEVGTNMSMHLMFFVDTAPASAKNVRWCIEWKAIAPGETVDFTSGTGTLCDTHAITTGTPANDAILIECEDMTGGAGAIAAEDLLLCRLYRDATHADDTFVGDARLIKAHVHYTANKLGEAL